MLATLTNRLEGAWGLGFMVRSLGFRVYKVSGIVGFEVLKKLTVSGSGL